MNDLGGADASEGEPLVERDEVVVADEADFGDAMETLPDVPEEVRHETAGDALIGEATDKPVTCS